MATIFKDSLYRKDNKTGIVRADQGGTVKNAHAGSTITAGKDQNEGITAGAVWDRHEVAGA